MATEPKKTTKSSNAAPVKLPRVTITSKAPVTDPGYSKQSNTIADTEQSFFNTTIESLRSLKQDKAIRVLTRIDSTVSAALNAYLQLGMSSGYQVKGYLVGTQQFSSQATLAAQSILAAFDTLYDYTAGFSDKQSLAGVLETSIKEVLQTGGLLLELVLNQYRLPEQLVVVPLSTIEWVPKQGSISGRFPRQISSTGGDPIPLDLPTIFYASHAQSSNTIFPRSPFESALNMLFMYKGLLEDVFKVIRRTGHTRLVVKIIQETLQKTVPEDIVDDPEAVALYFKAVRAEIEDTLRKLSPEDALVLFDSAEVDSISSAGDKADYSAVLDTLSGMLASSLKTMPSVLGMRLGGSQSLSNTETLVFLKMTEGVRVPVETAMSRSITLAVRLATGLDVYVNFRFNPVEIRPSAELSAHRSVDQKNTLELLSLGMISDDEAALRMGCFPRPAGARDLSGTGFMAKDATNPKDLVNQGDGPMQKSMNEGTANGPANSSGGGNNKVGG